MEPAVAEVNPVIVKFAVAPQVANGTGGAVVVEPEALQLEPFAKDKVATEPTSEMTEVPKFTIPVLVTVTTVPVPPVVVTVLLVLPPMVKVPAIFPVIPVPVLKAIAIALEALFKIRLLPEGISRSSPDPPVIVMVLVVAELETNVTDVPLEILKTPILTLAFTVPPVMDAPATVPAPSMTRTSVDEAVERAEPVPSAAVFQVAAVLNSAVAVPTQ